MSVTYDSFVGDTLNNIQYLLSASNTTLYPDSNTIAVTGAIWLPRIYAKTLTALELASSGKIALSLNDTHGVDIYSSNYINSSNNKTVIQSLSNYSLDLSANNNSLYVSLDAYSNNLLLTAPSNINLNTSTGNINITSTSNINLISSQILNANIQSDVNINSTAGNLTLNSKNSNLSISLSNTNMSLYSSNNLFLSACNLTNITSSSNLSLNSVAGDINIYSDNSNVSIVMSKNTDTFTAYTVSNMFLSSSNNFNITSKSNLSLTTTSGNFQVSGPSSNMFFLMSNNSNNVILYSLCNININSSNTFNINSTSNIIINSTAGDLKLASQSSNISLTFSSATNNSTLYASNNIIETSCNNINTTALSNINIATVAGDYKVYANNSNMFIRMSAITNNINIFSSNDTITSTSNSFYVYTKSNLFLNVNNSNLYQSFDSLTNNIIIYASNDFNISSSNTLNINTNSNVLIGALTGDIKMYSQGSNMSLVMDSSTNNISIYSLNNTSISVSNNYNLNTLSNIGINTSSGSFKAYADASNLYLTLDKTTDKASLFSISNVAIVASNTLNINTKSNILIGALAGDVKVYSQGSNMFLVMDSLSNNVSMYSSNNFSISVSNNYNVDTLSNIGINTTSGSFKAYADASNLYMTLDKTTDQASLFSISNVSIVASNTLNINTKSNILIGALAGDVKVYSQGSNMSLVMNSSTNDISMYSSNNTSISVSNNYNLNTLSNIGINTSSGSFKAYADASNLYMTLDKTTDQASLFSISNVAIIASNTLNINTKSNILIGALAGDVKVYSKGSNMSLVMDSTTNNTSIYSSNNFNLNTGSNIYIGALAGDVKVYSQGSNMSLVMDSLSNNVSMYSSNNFSISVSNNYTLDTLSNIGINTTSGSFKAYADASNLYLTLDKTTDQASLFSISNVSIIASNTLNINTKSNILIGALAGDVKVYSKGSNMSLVMDSTTNNTSIYSSNNFNLNTGSNIYIGALAGDVKVYSQGSNMSLIMNSSTNDISMYSSNNFSISVSNNYNLNTLSNIGINTSSGSFKAYADSSNLYMTLDKTIDQASLFSISNVSIIASNTLNINTKSNILIGALAGDVKVYSKGSNMSLVMDSTTNNTSIYSSNNFNLNTGSNIYIGALAGDVKVYSQGSNMSLVMDSLSNNVSMYSSNNLSISVSNNYNVDTLSNIGINTTSGSLKAYADASNLYLTLDKTTDQASLFSISNVSIIASNTLNINTKSNILIGALAGDVKVYSKGSNMSLVMDSLTNNVSIYASNNFNLNTGSNILIGALAGDVKVYSQGSNMSLVMDSLSNNVSMYSSNNLSISVSNNYNLDTLSNIGINTSSGSFKAYADASNLYLTLDKTTDKASLFSISNVSIVASNTLNINTKSNILIGALAGDVKVYSQGSNMSLVMDSLSNNVSMYSSNNLSISVSNSYTLDTLSNIGINTTSGSLKAYADSSNLYLTLDKTTDLASLFSISNVSIVASNTLNINTKSNILIGALAGDVKVYSQGSNMSLVMDSLSNNVSMYSSNNLSISVSNSYTLDTLSNIGINTTSGSLKAYADSSNLYLTLDKTTDLASLFSISNVSIVASNTLNINTKSNILIGALAGDVKVYSQGSNMSLIMDSLSNNVSMYSSNNLSISISNNYNLDTLSNIGINTTSGSLKAYADASNLYLTLDKTTDLASLFSISNVSIVASNTLNINTKSNILIGALAGDVKVYSKGSNMSIVMDSSTNNISIYSSNNTSISVSNNYTLDTLSNIGINTTSGSLKAYADASNLYLTLDKTIDQASLFSISNVSIVASNTLNINTKSNILIGALAGDVKVYSQGSNMSLVMDSLSNNVSMYSSNNTSISVSNNYTLDTLSNIGINTSSGSFKAYADASNLYMTLDKTIDQASLFSISNVSIVASNTLNINTKSNILIGALAGDVKVYSQGSNMSLVMDSLSNNVLMYSSNNTSISVSNNYNLDTLSNIGINTSSGSFKAYADASNLYMTLDKTIDQASLFSISNVSIVASNTLNINTKSNILIGALAGDVKVYSQGSNMSLVMDSLSNNVSIYSSNNLSISVSNNYTLDTLSNIGINTSSGSFKAYADASNLFLTLDKTIDKASLFSISNVDISSSNNININTKSNLYLNASFGDIKMYSQTSNTSIVFDSTSNNLNLYALNNISLTASNNYVINSSSNIIFNSINGSFSAYADNSNVFLTLDKTTDNGTLYALSNVILLSSNNINLTAKSNLNLSANNGDIKLYSQTSNMSIVMNSATNNINIFSSNNTTFVSSNNFTINSLSNISFGALSSSFKAYADSSNISLILDKITDNANLYAVSNINLVASNTLNVNAKSNVFIGALSGDFKVYSQGSNMSLVMDSLSNNVSIYSSNNLSISASNSYNLNTLSNIGINTTSGSLKAYADASNLYLTLDKTTDQATLFSISNVAIAASNTLNINTNSNIYIGALAGDVKVYSQGSNMSLVMDSLSNNVSMYSSNNLSISVSNSYTLDTLSNISINTTSGSLKAYADASNLYLTLDKTTDQASLFSISNVSIIASNTLNINTNSNILIGALAGDVKVYSQGSNMSLIMNSVTNDISMYSSNNLSISVSNNYTLDILSNIGINTTSGSLKAYADNSNLFLTLDKLTDKASLFSISNIAVIASNNLIVNTKSNIYMGALAGDVKIYSKSSNMSMIMDSLSNNITIYSSNNNYIYSSNSIIQSAYSNVTITAINGNLSLSSTSQYLNFNAISSNADLYSINNLNIIASNNYNISINNDTLINTKNYLLNANNSNMFILMDKNTNDITLFSSNNTIVSSSNDITLTGLSNVIINGINNSVSIYGKNSNSQLILDNNFNTYSSNNTSILTNSNTFISANNGTLNMYASSSNSSILMGTGLDIYSSNNINETACNSYSLEAKSNISLTAKNNNLSLFSSNNTIVTSSNDFILNARSNYNIYASKGSANIYANDSNMFINMDSVTNNVNIYGLNNIAISASNNFSLNSTSNIDIKANNGSIYAYSSSNMLFNADNSNMYINCLAPSDMINIYAKSNVSLIASNNLFLDSVSNIQLTSSNLNLTSHRDINIVASNNITISASNTLALLFGNSTTSISLTNNQTFSSQSNFSFFVQGAPSPTDPVLVIGPSNLLLRGDLVITGTLNTSNIFSTNVIQTTLKVEDKQILLASVGSNFNDFLPTDGIANTGAGITIDGFPTGFDSNIPDAYAKTLSWNNSLDGISAMGTSNIDSESYWEMKGGSFRITHQKIVQSGGSNIIKDVSAIFRINENDELELCKRFYYDASNAYVTKRIAKFGKII
jgi:uncharacterized protein (DUF2345 family)